MKTILLLEDLPEIRAWLRKLVLEVFPGSHLSESARVHDAIELVKAVKFDLALIDLGLPDGNGIELIKQVSQKKPEADIMVVTVFGEMPSCAQIRVQARAGRGQRYSVTKSVTPL